MELLVLGCDGSHPGPGGAGSGYLMVAGGTRILFDCGPGVLGRLLAWLAVESLDAVVISHEHPDHRSDLDSLGLASLYRRGGSRLRLFGPPGLDRLAYPPTRDAFAWQTVEDGDRVTVGEVDLAFSQTDHGPPTLAVRADWGAESFAYSADTGPGWSFEALGAGINLGLCEATWTKETEGRGHLTGRQAGEMARAAGVERLLITHRAPGTDPNAVFREASDAFGAETLLAKDLSWYLLVDRGGGHEQAQRAEREDGGFAR
jgi:ribonuclease BN (tRNA processing enzyme)